jgi:mannose-6-phosphate isomerase-like protein (cupin superfamily)
VKFVPGPGETRLMFVTFPPDAVMMRADFDPAAFGAEFAQNAPGLAERFEMDSPGMHTTDSIDYDVVLEGEIVLELDGGKEVLLKAHDVCVQHGTRHAWRNRSDKPATMLFVLVGASRRRSESGSSATAEPALGGRWWRPLEGEAPKALRGRSCFVHKINKTQGKQSAWQKPRRWSNRPSTACARMS